MCMSLQSRDPSMLEHKRPLRDARQLDRVRLVLRLPQHPCALQPDVHENMGPRDARPSFGELVRRSLEGGLPVQQLPRSIS